MTFACVYAIIIKCLSLRTGYFIRRFLSLATSNRCFSIFTSENLHQYVQDSDFHLKATVHCSFPYESVSVTRICIELCHNKSRNCSIEKIIYLQSSTSYSTDFCWQLLIRWFDGLYLRHKANLNRESNGRTALYCIEISFEAENLFPLQYIVTVVLKEPDVHYNLARSFGMWNLVTKQYRCLKKANRGLISAQL